MLVRLEPPEKPNGEISEYNIYVNKTRRETSLGNNLQVLDNLKPYTNYEVVLEACTGGGCVRSEPRMFFTNPLLPSGIDSPVAIDVSASFFLKLALHTVFGRKEK